MDFLTVLELLQRSFKSDKHQAPLSGKRGLMRLICHEQIKINTLSKLNDSYSLITFMLLVDSFK